MLRSRVEVVGRMRNRSDTRRLVFILVCDGDRHSGSALDRAGDDRADRNVLTRSGNRVSAAVPWPGSLESNLCIAPDRVTERIHYPRLCHLRDLQRVDRTGVQMTYRHRA